MARRPGSLSGRTAQPTAAAHALAEHPHPRMRLHLLETASASALRPRPRRSTSLFFPFPSNIIISSREEKFSPCRNPKFVGGRRRCCRSCRNHTRSLKAETYGTHIFHQVCICLSSRAHKKNALFSLRRNIASSCQSSTGVCAHHQSLFVILRHMTEDGSHADLHLFPLLRSVAAVRSMRLGSDKPTHICVAVCDTSHAVRPRFRPEIYIVAGWPIQVLAF